MLSIPRLVRWLVSVEDDEDGVRQSATYTAYKPAELAAHDGLITQDPPGYGDFARMMGRAEKDGWITWNWQRRAGDPKPDQPNAESLNDQDLQRCEYVRVLPAGREYAAPEEQAKEAGPTAPPTPILRGEQLEVLRELVKEARAVERSQRRFYLSITSGPDMVQGPAGQREVLAEDIYALQEAGAFQVRAEFVGGDMEFTISPDGEAMADAAAREDPPARIEEEITRVYMDSEAFKAAHPVAYQRAGMRRRSCSGDPRRNVN